MRVSKVDLKFQFHNKLKSLVVVLKQLLAFMTPPIVGDIFHTQREERHRNREKCVATSSPTFSFLYLSPFETDSFHDCLNICQHKIRLIIFLLSIYSTNDSSKCRQKLEKKHSHAKVHQEFLGPCKICIPHLANVYGDNKIWKYLPLTSGEGDQSVSLMNCAPAEAYCWVTLHHLMVSILASDWSIPSHVIRILASHWSKSWCDIIW